MIKVDGYVTLGTKYAVRLDMTEEEFDALSPTEQNQLIDESINWHETIRSAGVEELDVWSVEKI